MHERKHRVAKRYAENVRKVDGTFDLSVLKDVLASNLRDLKDREILPLGIRNAREAPMSLKRALVSLLGNSSLDLQTFEFPFGTSTKAEVYL